MRHHLVLVQSYICNGLHLVATFLLSFTSYCSHSPLLRQFCSPGLFLKLGLFIFVKENASGCVWRRIRSRHHASRCWTGALFVFPFPDKHDFMCVDVYINLFNTLFAPLQFVYICS